MPIKECTLPSGGQGWQWGDSGKCYASRADAEKQAQAAYANGYGGDVLAFDRGSLRTVDSDGHMHIASSIISAAQVNDYLGREIPDYERLGLAPEQRYALLRDPVELEKAAKTFHGKPLLIVHRPQVAGDHDKSIVVGSVNNPEWDNPNVKAELTIWDAKAIAAIESGEQKDLSAGYRYVPVMEAGTYNGVRYDGRMTEIEANHVALVSQGRVIGAMVGDEALKPTSVQKEKNRMSSIVLSRKAAVSKGALLAYLRPKMAADASIDLDPIVSKLDFKNFKESKVSVFAELRKELDGKLAKDAKIDDLTKSLDAMEDDDTAEDDWDDDNDKKKKDEDDAEDAAEEDLDDEKASAGEKEAEKKKQSAVKADKRAKDKAAKDKAAKDAEEDDKDSKGGGEKGESITKGAMDAAIANVRKEQRELREAERFVAPYVGEIAIACDSAEQVHRAALKILGVKNAEKVHASALTTLISMHPTISARKRDNATLAADAAPSDDFLTRFPDAARIGVA